MNKQCLVYIIIIECILDSPAKADKKKSVAKKSTTQGSTLNTGQIWEAPWIKIKKDKGGAEDKKPSLKVQSQGNTLT
jgi:hypothetical protein